MGSLQDACHEHFLHWTWGSLHFDLHNLYTVSGERLTILDPGELNPSDGPDFKQARLRIGKLNWHGDVEIHWKASDWKHHGHHDDPNYNRVILHVVYDNSRAKPPSVCRKDLTSPYTLIFKPHLPANLTRLIARFERQDQLPCSGHIRNISPGVFDKQLERAHREYFESKTEELLHYYNADLPPGKAWKYILILGLFDGLGIAMNREQMRSLARVLISEINTVGSRDELAKMALSRSGLKGLKRSSKIPPWNMKSCRPNNRPELRIRQAAELMWHILPTSFTDWNQNEPSATWNNMIEKVRTRPAIGRSRSELLFGIVFLPALYLLGNLFHSSKLKQKAFNSWMSHRTDIPDSVLRLYKNSNFPPGPYRQQLGAVYQLNHYCKPRRCQDCEVIKEAISS